MLTASVLMAVGGKEAFYAKYRQYESSVAFVRTKRRQLLEAYEDSWVAVYGAKVVAHDKRYQTVAKNIRAQGIPIENVVIEYLSKQPMIALF
jgi:hypothetical protein